MLPLLKLAIVLFVMLFEFVVNAHDIPFNIAAIFGEETCMLPAVVVLPIVFPEMLKGALGIPPVLIPLNVVSPLFVPAITNELITLFTIEPENEEVLDI